MRVKYVILFFYFILFFVNTANAEIENSEYYFLIEENGNTIVGITLYGSGEITIPIQEDLETLNVEGGLYIMENNTLTIAVGSTEKAVLVYQTNLLTEKSGEDWKFSADFEEEIEKNVIVAMPKETIVRQTNPSAIVESGDFIKLTWTNPKNIIVEYSFLITPLKEDRNNNLYYFIGGISALILISVFFYLLKHKKYRISVRQEQLLQTLTDNERKIVELLLENKNPVKRSFIEKRLELAKSSLATTLNNLERKKILEIDRTFSSHFIKITDWFKKM